MANPSKIDWTDESCNPVWGCFGPSGTAERPARCQGCYAFKMAPRIAAMRAASTGEPVCEQCRDFVPHFHPERLPQLTQGHDKRVFVGSMCDLWSDGVLPEWREAIWRRVCSNACRAGGRNHFIVLTKCPERIDEREVFMAWGGAEVPPKDACVKGSKYFWPANLWVGTSAADAIDYALRWRYLRDAVPRGRRVLSLEPMHGWIDFVTVAPSLEPPYPDWILLGPQTPVRDDTAPERRCVEAAIRWTRERNVPLWLKSGCYKLWPDLPHTQEIPEAMR